MVDPVRAKIEVERIVNLVTALNWAKTEERIEDDSLVITFKKKLPETPGEE